jgi:cell filamentation protein
MRRKSIRYREPSGTEGSFQPGSHRRVLANLKGITSKRMMDLAEYQALVLAQKQYYHTLTPMTRFTAALLCQMHQDWLGELYAWAGRYRTVELQKAKFAWPPAWRVAGDMKTFEQKILRCYTPCRPSSLKMVTEAMARVHAELLLIHPFREGNGRLARWLSDLMAVQASYPVPDYALSGRGSIVHRQNYIAAMSQGYGQNYKPLAFFFAEAIRRAERR